MLCRRAADLLQRITRSDHQIMTAYLALGSHFADIRWRSGARTKAWLSVGRFHALRLNISYADYTSRWIPSELPPIRERGRIYARALDLYKPATLIVSCSISANGE